MISPKGREFRDRVILIARNTTGWIGSKACFGYLQIAIDVYPPDNRRRDLDNLLKSLLDALQHAGCYDDDDQLWKITIERFKVVPGGKMIIRLSESKPLAEMEAR